MTDFTVIDGIGEETKKILNSKGAYKIEDFRFNVKLINDVVWNTSISSEKLAKIFTYAEIGHANKKMIDEMRKNKK